MIKIPWVFGAVVLLIGILVIREIIPLLQRLQPPSPIVIHPPQSNLGQKITNHFNRVHGIVPPALSPQAAFIPYEAGRDL